MHIIQVDLDNTNLVKKFLKFPFSIYKNIPQWVPQLEMDARRMLDQKKNPFFKHSTALFLLATDGKQPVGRLAILENRNYNQFNSERTAFFYLFECINSQEIANAIFSTGFQWAKERGLNHVIGSKGFSVMDGIGVLVKGFEHRPALGLPYNPDYYPVLIEGVGFRGYADLVSGYLSAKMEFPDKVHQIAEMVSRRRGLSVTKYKNRKELKSLVPHLRDLYNSALTGSTGTVPLTEEEAKAIAAQMLWFADPRLIKIVMKDNQPVGFLFGYPDVSAALQKTGGKIFPLGWFHLLRELKRTDWINLNGAGVVDGYRGVGGTALLFSEMYKSVTSGTRYRHADIVQIGVENSNMQREMREFGIDFYKTHRLYEKYL